jgi:hypothetical protein
LFNRDGIDLAPPNQDRESIFNLSYGQPGRAGEHRRAGKFTGAHEVQDSKLI